MKSKQIKSCMVVLLALASAMTNAASSEPRIQASKNEPRSQREFAEHILVKILNGELLHADSKEVAHAFGDTNWLSKASFIFGRLGVSHSNKIKETFRIYLWPDQNGYSPYCIGIEMSQPTVAGETMNELLMKRFFSGEDITLKDNIFTIRQYWISLPGSIMIYYYSNGAKKAFFITERGSLEINFNPTQPS